MGAPGALTIGLRPSRLLVTGLVALHAGAIAAVVASAVAAALPAASWILAAVLLCWNGVAMARRVGLLTHPRAVVGIALASDRRCALRLRDGSSIEGVVDGASVVIASLVVLVVRRPGRQPLRAVIAPDMAPPEDRRRLRVLLRWGRAQDAGARSTLASMIRPR